MSTTTDDGTWKTEADITDKERYQRYLAGREWGLLRKQVKERSGGICERCKINKSEAVHHLTYERKYNERIEDLQDTCDACHKFTHGLSDEDPMGTPGILAGVIETRGWVWLFFLVNGGGCPDDEVIWRAPCWDMAKTCEMLGAEEIPKWGLYLKSFLGCTYSIRLKPSSSVETGSWVESFCPSIEQLPLVQSDIRRFFSFSTDLKIDATFCGR